MVNDTFNKSNFIDIISKATPKELNEIILNKGKKAKPITVLSFEDDK